MAQSTEKDRLHIATTVRELRKGRGWAQADLAGRLGLSQSRLSEIERGDGSFTAEQLLLLLQLFNVDVARFTRSAVEPGDELQNALVRFGARHLREVPNVVATGRYRLARDVVRDVLFHQTSSRFVTALAPVVVWNIDEIGLPALQDELARVGYPNRLGWLAENLVEALDGRWTGWERRWALAARRAFVVLGNFQTRLAPSEQPGGWDLLDSSVRSRATLEQLTREASTPSRRWGIVTGLLPEDFRAALEAAVESAV